MRCVRNNPTHNRIIIAYANVFSETVALAYTHTHTHTHTNTHTYIYIYIYIFDLTILNKTIVDSFPDIAFKGAKYNCDILSPPKHSNNLAW